MNKLINIVLSGLLWRRYKFLLVSLVITVISMVIVGQIHQDYLSYNALLEEPKHVGLSFALKWLIWIGSVILFLGVNHWYNQKKQAEKELDSGGTNTALKKLLGRLQVTSTDEKSEQPQKKGQPKDPFEALRSKDKLRSYADVIIEKKQSND
ncbi:hypothetical protein [Glaciecola sp. KUL10]|uniref:hypothetical protein n=1 Tax=Glaciecola sp. (strain KUL10) TaxID=2161813 RepID=UPI000D78C7FB|nr:hypothetical protein [Glaciecola sp. KUL10]GBL05852.1 hypothetical protein KUL10_31850 [Glaciecola sp. KUL10]